jgi:chemotaxis protein MotB
MCLLLGPVACVSQGTYDQAVLNARSAQQSQAKSVAQARATQLELQRLQERVNAVSAALSKEEALLKAAQDDGAALRAQLDGSVLANAGLAAALGRVGKSAVALSLEKGALAQSLDQAKQRLEELRKAQAAAEARAALFRDLALKLRKMVDAGELKIVLRDGRMVLQLPNEVLFDSGRTALKANGKEALATIAQALNSLAERHFQVAGHTDNVPIKNANFASNWELSCGRALVVVHFLTSQGVPPSSLSAAGFGEFDPIASNESAEGRQANRRTEIALQPKIDELVAVPEAP